VCEPHTTRHFSIDVNISIETLVHIPKVGLKNEMKTINGLWKFFPYYSFEILNFIKWGEKFFFGEGRII